MLIGNEEDFTAALGVEVPGVDASLVDLDVGAFATMIDAVVATSSLRGRVAAKRATSWLPVVRR